MSKDEDFLYLASRPNAKLRLLWVQLGNCRTPALLAAFERHWPLIESALKAGLRIFTRRLDVAGSRYRDVAVTQDSLESLNHRRPVCF